MMVQAMVIFYGSAYFGADMDPVTCGLFIVSINTGAYMAETVRGGIQSIDPGQNEGAGSHWHDARSDDASGHPAAGIPQ